MYIADGDSFIRNSESQKIMGVGMDILRIRRISGALDDEPFIRKTFTEKERDLSKKRERHIYYYAKLFACKEAVFKSLGIHANVIKALRDIEVLDGDVEQPVVHLHNTLAAVASQRGIAHIFLSCSYETEYAMAFAIAMGGSIYGYNEKYKGQDFK
jgi:phosphopantetheine--protein transferase-like protein